MLETEKKESGQIDFSAMGRAELEEFAMKNHTRLKALEMELEIYKELIRKNRSNMFGSSSERHISEAQLSLFNEAEEIADPDLEEPAKYDVLPVPKRKKRKGHKKGLTAKFPKEAIEYKLTDEERVCPKCNGEITGMKTNVRTEIEVIPAEFKVIEHRTEVGSCRNCDKTGTEGTIITAASPKGMFRNSLASPSMVADIMWKKFGLAQPFYRQSQELSRLGLEIGRNTFASWVITAAFLYLTPVRNHMKSILVGSDAIHGDETPVQVLHEEGKSAESDSFMWVYRTGKYEKSQVVLFDYSRGRGAEYPEAFLDGFKGYIHCDGYQAYRTLVKENATGPPDIVIVSCWAHVRRYFTDIIKGLAKNTSIKGTATEKALAYIGDLFKIEDAAKGMPADQRFLYRKKYAAPIVDKYFTWLKSIKDSCGGSLGKAVNYSLNQEKDLRAYLTDGRLEISNNFAENAIRPFCVGRRNWLFSDTPNGAAASAVCYGVIETAKANGVNAFEYLKYIFTVFKDAEIESLDMEDFMPWSPSLPDACRKSDEPAKELAS
jgi:transposase